MLFIAKGSPKILKKQDGGHTTVSQRLRFALSPLFTLWKTFSSARQGSCAEAVNVNNPLTLVEQTIVGLGEAAQSVDHQCRMKVLERLMQNPKKCLEILAQNDEILEPSDSDYLKDLSTWHCIARPKAIRSCVRPRTTWPLRNVVSSAPPLASPFNQGLPMSVPETIKEAEVETRIPVPLATIASSSMDEAMTTAMDVVPFQNLPQIEMVF